MPPLNKEWLEQLAAAMQATRPTLPPALRKKLDAIVATLPPAGSTHRSRRILRLPWVWLAAAALLLGALFLLPQKPSEHPAGGGLPSEVLAWEPPRPLALVKPRPVYTFRTELDLRLAQLSADAASLHQALNPEPITTK
jgi:hypothetical protein